MSNFKVGEKVVCVDPIKKLIKDEIYTISEIKDKHYSGEIGILVEEIEVENNDFGGVNYYNIKRFRKLDHQFAEDICAELVKQVKEEQLILN